MPLLRSFLFGFLLTAVQFSFAQIRATTESGNKVLLFDDGTWKYDETRKEVASSAIAAVVAESATLQIDSSREISTDPVELFYASSPRLVKFFGEMGSNIRCKISCSNYHGVIKLHFGWEIPVSDGHRYFGMLKEGSTVTLTLEDRQQIVLVMGDENELKRLEKFNSSVISNATIPLSTQQLTSLMKQPLEKMEVEWRKDSEEYRIEQTQLLMDALPTVF